MSEEQSRPIELWVRTDKGVVYGPLSPTSIELLLDNQVITGRVQISVNGNEYVYPGRMPGVRIVFPRAVWGDVVTPGDAEDAAFSQVVAPPPLPGVPARAPAGGAAPTAGPGTRPAAVGPGQRATVVAGPGIMAGPGARQQAVQRPLNAPRPQGVAVVLPVQPSRSSGSGVQRAPPVSSGSSVQATAPNKLFDNLDADLNRASGSAVRAAIPPVAPAVASPAAEPKRSSPSGLRPPPIEFGPSSMPLSGSLSDHSPARLYFIAASQNVTGLLTATLPDRVVQVHFRKGNAELVDSNHADDLLTSFLVRQQLASYDQLGQAEKEKGRFGGELVAALFGLGVLNPATAVERLTQRSTAMLGRLLLSEQGSFTFELKELPAARALPLGNKWSLFAEQLRVLPGLDARRRLVSVLDLPIMKAGGPVNASDLRLSPQETRALTFFDGVRTLNQLLADQPSDADVMLRTAWMLRDCDLVAFSGTPVPSPPPSSVQAPPPPSIAAPVAPAVAGGVPFITPAGAPTARPSQSQAKPPVAAPPSVTKPSAPPVAAAPQPTPAVRPATPPPPVGGSVPGPPVAVAQRQTVPYPGQKPPAPAAPPPPAPPVAVAAAPRPAPPPRPVVTAAVAAPAGGAANHEAEIARLQKQLDASKKQNHFAVLGIDLKADAAAVKAAYFKAARALHPDTVPPDAPPALGKLKADLFARVGEANRTLADPKLRADYEGDLAAGGTGEKVDISSILAAEETFQKGQILVKARKFPEAVAALDEAIRANAEEGEYYAWRGFAKFFTTPDRAVGQAEALKDINLCLKKNPNVAAVWYFQGTIAKLTGDAATAKKHFQKCVSIDPKHVDAQRELRLAK